MEKPTSTQDMARPGGDSAPFEVPALPEGIGMQPQLDTIFAEVQASLPSIDFDLSDVSSDEEIAVVSRSLKTPTALDPHQEIEMSPETWRSALEPSNKNAFFQEGALHQCNSAHSSSQSSSRKTSDDSDDGAAKLMSLDSSIVQVGSAHAMVGEDSAFISISGINSDDNQMHSWSDLMNTLEARENGMRTPTNFNAVSNGTGWTQDPGSDSTVARNMALDNRNAPTETYPKADTNSTENEKKRPSTDLEKSRISSMIPIEAPKLSMQDVEDIDLDLLLDSFPAPASRRPEENSRRSPHPQTGGGDGTQTADRGNLSLMEKLAQLCVQQSSGTLSKTQLLGPRPESPRTRKVAWAEGAAKQDRKMRDMGTNTEMDDPMHKHQVPKSTVSIGVSTQSRPVLEYSTHTIGVGTNAIKKERTQTVFLDLRVTTAAKEEKEPDVVPESVKRILQLNSPGGSESDASESSQDEEEDLQVWRENRKRGFKGPSPPQGAAKKSVLKATPPPRVIMLKSDKEKPQTETPITISHAQSAKTKAMPPTLQTTSKQKTAAATHAKEATGKALPATPPPSPTTATAPIKALNQEHLLQDEMRQKLREQREQERAARMRLQKRLEVLRPRLSASGKRPAARSTPIIYDMEASYTASPHCLPPILCPDQECALLTVQLSTSGEIVPQRCPSSDRAVSRNCISITYQLLLTWLLSLVPPEFDYLAEGITKPVADRIPKPESHPFWVVGLQQLYRDDGPILNVAVTPTGPSTGRQHMLKRKTKGLGKESTRDSTPFQAHLSTFLTINTLLTVCPWVESTFACTILRDGGLADTSDQASYDTVLDDGSYVPAFPHISSKPLSMLLTLSQDREAVQRVFPSSEAAFFWQTVDADEAISDLTSTEEYDNYADVQNTMSLVYKSVYRNPRHMLGFYYRILQESLDIAGVRLLYPVEELTPPNGSPRERKQREMDSGQLLKHVNKVGPILAVAIRGAMARTRWLDAMGPSDPQLARRTDPRSLVALFGGQTREEVPMYCPRNPNRVSYELALWFGGRVPESGVVDVGSAGTLASQLRAESGKGQLNQRGRRGKRGSQADLGDQLADSLEVIKKPPYMLVATTQSDIFLVVSPLVPPMCTGGILSACLTRGYQLRGVRRLRLNNKRVSVLGLTGAQVRAFNPLSCTTPTSPAQNYELKLRQQLEAEFPQARPSPMPSMVLLLRKENGLHHAAGLVEALMVHLCVKGMLTTIKESSPSGTLTTSLCFHVAPYSESLLGHLGGDLTGLPTGNLQHSGLGSPPGGFYTNPELEQVVVVTFSGAKALKTVGNTLIRLLGLYPFTPSSQPPSSPMTSLAVGQGLELLGLKWLASLTAAQAKELTPYEVGDRYWQPSVQALASNPALVCVVRGLNAPQLVQSILGTSPVTGALPGKGIANLECIVSMSAEAAFRQATLFFRDQELFADPTMRLNLPYLPPLRSPSLEELSTARFAWAETETGEGTSLLVSSSSPSKNKKGKGKGLTKQQGKGMLVVEESIYKAMLVGPRLLTTVAVIKPLAFRKHLAKILKRIAQENFAVVALRLAIIGSKEAEELVPKEDKQDKMLCALHQEHLMSGPVLLLCLQRENAVRKLLDLLGPANPQDARRQSQFLWRGMYGADPINNGIHGSESYQAAVNEQKLLFPDGLCCRETADLQADKIICPARDSVMGYQQACLRCFVTKPHPVRTDSNDSFLSPVSSTHSLTSISSGSSTSSTDLLLPSHSALCQTNCLLLTPPLLLTKVKGYYRGHIEVVDALLAHGFTMVGMRMVWFDEDQAQEYSGIYSKSFLNLPKILCHGPSIVVAVERDNAVSCFDALLGSCFDKESAISKYGEHILRPKDPKEASKHLEFFFDKLVPRSQGEIVPR
ncbi:uncharacterized protein LOC110989830 [Acanthaster planci]|uniref:Uncharacterized protein LOC110989830 n=1 Tax=Acanthaster planci TaxID=133434 RepID=A0A8B7ZZL2_ACAPL|nr:uncharacterized protein LOC110989830 [Acanthaster planci]